ncbi:MAG TPA: GNAT family N-acetyltransferase [Mycobacteriales bacterium]
MDEVTVSRARALWEELAGGRFPDRGGVRVLQTTTSRLCPPGWAGMVMLAGAVLANAPTAAQAALLREALLDAASREAALLAAASRGAAPPDVTVPGAAPREAARLDTGSLPVRDALGPAALAYLAPGDFQSYGDERPEDPERPAPGVEWAGPAEIAGLLATVDPAEANESGLDGLPRAAVVRVGGRVVAASGYDRWPAGTAHLCVLTATGHRGRGHATRVAAVATADALAAGLLPQWRAQVLASRRVADKLGYRVLGQQRSLLLADQGDGP